MRVLDLRLDNGQPARDLYRTAQNSQVATGTLAAPRPLGAQDPGREPPDSSTSARTENKKGHAGTAQTRGAPRRCPTTLTGSSRANRAARDQVSIHRADVINICTDTPSLEENELSPFPVASGLAARSRPQQPAKVPARHLSKAIAPASRVAYCHMACADSRAYYDSNVGKDSANSVDDDQVYDPICAVSDAESSDEECDECNNNNNNNNNNI